VSDTYQEALKLLRELHPFAQPKDGERIAIVAAYLSPSDDHQNALKWRALLDLYRLEHVQSCDCPLCQRYDALVGKKAEPLPLPLELVA
jgi:hypothetical protein